MKLVDSKTFASMSAQQRALYLWLADCPAPIKEVMKYDYSEKLEVVISLKGSAHE
tara:strand:- start:144 stop:308 length:165 start_codon:yes stop_codon:yes gene_type:complete